MSIRTETATIHEFDAVELLVDLPGARLFYPEVDTAPLHAGDSGVVVSAHDEDRAITVEFFRDGETVAITGVRREQVRRVDSQARKEREMQLDYVFLADRIEMTPESPWINAFGIGTNDFLFSKFPSAVPSIWLVAGFMLQPGDFDTPHPFEIEFWNPDGMLQPRMPAGVIQQTAHNLDPSARVRFHSGVNIAGLPFPAPGPYEIRLFVDGTMVGSLRINARHDPTLTIDTPGAIQVPPQT